MEDYSNFVFYGSWKTLLDGFSKEQAKEILWQIVNYGVGSSFDTDDKMIIAIIQGAIAPTINAAQDRYLKSVVNGKKGGRPKKAIDLNEAKEMMEKGISKKAIAEHFNVSTDTLERRFKESSQNIFAEEMPQNCSAKTAIPQNLYKDTDIDIYSDKDTDIDNANLARFARDERKERFEYWRAQGRSEEEAQRAADLGF